MVQKTMGTCFNYKLNYKLLQMKNLKIMKEYWRE